jgi:hypothetical protein
MPLARPKAAARARRTGAGRDARLSLDYRAAAIRMRAVAA